MLDHPIFVVLNVIWHWIATGLKVNKFMGIQIKRSLLVMQNN